MNRVIRIFICVMLVGLAAESRAFEAQRYKSLPYRFLKPKDFDEKKTYPLVLFFHGAGERGGDNGKQLKWVVGIFAQPENMEKYPCFVAAPQCPGGQQWVNTPWGNPSHVIPEQPSAPMALALELVDELCKTYPIDKNRIYVMGLSMGGYGAWDALARRPELFAAGVPICGGADEATAPKIKNIPVWAFHGAKDIIVPVSRSQNMVKALKDAGADPKYTEYPNVDHGSWIPAASEPGLLPWLFEQDRGQWEEKAKKARQKKLGAVEVKPDPGREARTWTSKQGKTVEATLLKTKDGGKTVVLKKADGSLAGIPLDKLSEEDQEYVLSVKEEAGKAK